MLYVCVYTYFYILILSNFYDSQEYCVIVKEHSSNAEFLAK